MSVRSAKPEPVLRDAEGWKIMWLETGGRLVSSVWGHGTYLPGDDEWYQAIPHGYIPHGYGWPALEPRFGFHAYASRGMALRSLEEYRRSLEEYQHRWRPGREGYVLVRVTLGDVFLSGQDNTFGLSYEDELLVLVARAMKVEEVIR